MRRFVVHQVDSPLRVVNHKRNEAYGGDGETEGGNVVEVLVVLDERGVADSLAHGTSGSLTLSVCTLYRTP